MPILIRFNTDHVMDNTLPKWRMYVDGEQMCVDEIKINVPCQTSTDFDEHVQQLKHHISIATYNTLAFETASYKTTVTIN